MAKKQRSPKTPDAAFFAFSDARLTCFGMPATAEDVAKISAFVGLDAEQLQEALQLDLLE